MRKKTILKQSIAFSTELFLIENRIQFNIFLKEFQKHLQIAVLSKLP